MMGIRYFAASLALLTAVTVSAQDDFRKEFESFRRQSMQTYTDFRRQCNDSYVEFMKGAWEGFTAKPAREKPQEKPVPPVVLEQTPVIEDRPLPVVEVVPAPTPEPQPQPLSPIDERPVVRVEKTDFNFFGLPISIRSGESLKFKLLSTKGDDISSAWQRLSGRDYDNTLYDCLLLRDKYKLCDWAYLLMIFSFTDRFLGRGNESTLMAAYLFSQSGYKMRMGLSDKGIALLFGTRYQLYGIPCFEIDGENFFQFQGTDLQMQIVNYSFPNEKPVSFDIVTEQCFGASPSEPRTLAWGISCTLNNNLLKFYSTYPSSQIEDNPLTRWAMYARAPLASDVKEQLYPALKKKMEGKSKLQAAGVLLDFVRGSLKYELDDKVWGRDRAFYAEETLFYPYSDCEDRAILYSRLVRDLLGLDVLLVYYPGHLATAVKFPSGDEVKGDCIILEAGRYTVCDPTYEGAPVGLTMPGMDNSSARVILL